MAQTLQARGFDYDGLPSDFVDKSQKRVWRIRELDAETGRNVCEMGKLLKEQRDAFGSLRDKKGARGNNTWDAWVKAELGWSSGRKHANRLIQISDKFDDVESTSCLGFEAMKMLAADSADTIRDNVIKLAQGGNPPTISEIREMKRKAAGEARPTPTEAKAKAQATGEVVIGSDDRIYTPMPEDEERAYQARMSSTYDAIDAINRIAGMEANPGDWLRQAETHWLSDFNLGAVERAAGWINELISEYKKQKRIIENGK